MQARTVALDDLGSPEPTWVETVVEEPEADWVVHVLGAVERPGIVRVAPGSRVIDAIEAAGGFSPQADPAALNLAAMICDGCQIIVGDLDHPQGEVRVGNDGAGGGGPPTETNRLNLNQANETQLLTLPGVGPVTAKAILAWRAAHGPFTSVAQLQEVDGIGPKTFAQIEPYVSV
ncbi:MAG: ComEA family DNA-binding protein [Propionibacteriaceae bacterium]|nr:ComEA family DNA-binding protein [Propionibacteriaceae bacterium]